MPPKYLLFAWYRRHCRLYQAKKEDLRGRLRRPQTLTLGSQG